MSETPGFNALLSASFEAYKGFNQRSDVHTELDKTGTRKESA